MVFGKKKPLASASSNGPNTPARFRAVDKLREASAKIFNDTANLSAQLRRGDPFSVTDEGGPPLTSPIDWTDIKGNFQEEKDGKLHYHFYAFLTTPKENLPSAQALLMDMLSRIFVINGWAQKQAGRCDNVPDDIKILLDHILISSAFFALFFENFDASTQILTSPDNTKSLLKAMHEKYQDKLAAAQQHMFFPASYPQLLPTQRWPVLTIQASYKSEAPHKFINEVYFPEEFAKPILAHLAHEQAKARSQARS